MIDNKQLRTIISEIKYKYNLNQSEIAGKLDIKPTYLSDVINGRVPFSDNLKEKLASTFVNLSNIKYELYSDSITKNLDEALDDKYTLVPMYNFDAVGGMHTCADVTDMSEYIDKYVPFIDAYSEDICMPVSGNSMIPVYPPGCIVLLREVRNWEEYFGFGNDFVLILKDGRRLIKNVRKGEEDRKKNILCVSHNKDYDNEELPRNFIHKVYRIIKVLISIDF